MFYKTVIKSLSCVLTLNAISSHTFFMPAVPSWGRMAHRTTHGSLSIKQVASGSEGRDLLVIRVADVDVPVAEADAIPAATVETHPTDRQRIIEVSVSGGQVRVVVQDGVAVRVTLQRRIEQYRDQEGVVSSSVQQETVSRSHLLDKPLVEDYQDIAYNKADRELVIRLQVNSAAPEKHSIERVPVTITIEE